MLVDGFRVAEVMQREHPVQFQILTQTPVVFYDVGVDSYQFFMRAQHPTIKYVILL